MIFRETKLSNGDDIELLFVRRAINPRDRWSGQMAFPGGRQNINETDHEMCFACREPLTDQEILSEKYVLDECCPYCYEKNGPGLIVTND